ncbi:haloacid dehalogenase [Mycobacterium shimoidei]|nr:haloacid dehalogenase [Mycobacterium shimoidei]
MEMATIAVREGAHALSLGRSGSSPTRRCWAGDGRAWIEVRGLGDRDAADCERAVLEAVRSVPGVTSARLNRPLSRVVVEVDGEATSLESLCRAVDEAERRSRRSPRPSHSPDTPARPGSLPGDGLLLASRAVLLGVNAAGLGVALAGRALRLPGAPIAVNAAAEIANHQPWLRGLLAERIGTGATETVLSLTTAAANIVTLSPASLSVELMLHGLKAVESRAQAQAWERYEPLLARHAEHGDVAQPSRPVPPPDGPVERHAKRIAWVQAVGTGLVGALTANLNTAATAAVVAAPKAVRTTRESFTATLGAGLAEHHGVLPLRPESLRRLDKVDALLIDPRVLYSDTLRVVGVRGARPDKLSAAWSRAQKLLDDPGIQPGWQPVPGMAGVDALIHPAQHPLAAAVVTQARASGPEMVTVDADILGELRPAFDEVRPVGGSIDDALAQALADLQESGRTVAVLSSAAEQALASGDVALGVIPKNGSAPPWNADLLLEDLGGAWHVLHALPAAKQASQRGIAISAGASALGALFLVPGVRGARGPGLVTGGAAAGLMSGYLLARRVVRTAAPRPAPAYEWHAMSPEQARELLASLDTQSPRAISDSRAPERGFWQFAKAVRAELSDPLTPVLALGSAATAVLGSPLDAAMVGTVLVGNSLLAAGQRLRAESRLNRLLAQQTPPARKVTTGPDGSYTYSEILAEELTPGDLIEVRSNEVVPADARLIAEEDLEVDESSLTGESLSVEKHIEATPGAELADRRCMLYAGTHVVAGTGVAVVTAVGADTQERRASELASGELPAVGLQHQLSQLTSRAFPATATGGALVGGLGLLRGAGLRHALGNGIAVAVAAVPEGMPLVATLAQQASAWRLSKFGALVRVPRSVEALGRVDVVCFDKTGTLSENRLQVTLVHPVSGQSREEVLRCAANAAPTPNGARHAHATDQAIIEAALQVNGESLATQRDAHLPFRSGRAFSATVSGNELTVKGAPEVVLDACQDTDAAVHLTVSELAAKGLRVITVARRELTAQQVQSVRKDPDSIVELCSDGLSLQGFLGLSDTPRPAAARLLADLAAHDVAIRLITGDHPITATAIAGEMGLPVTPEQVITGSEWNALSRKEQERVVTERVIFARMSPENKVQVVQTLERAGRVCAMVGDGSNDAAAIRAATVGVGVVAHGSDPAHTVADVVLTDGRIEALLDAIEEGRRLWQRVQAAVSVLLGGNASQVLFAIVGSAFSPTPPMNTRQLLLMNVFTDALPAAALAVSMPSGQVKRPGRGPDERTLWRAVAVRGGTTAAAATAAWAMAAFSGRPQRASTVALIALVATQLGQTLMESHAPLVVLTAAGSFAVFGVLISTPGLSQLFGSTPVGPVGWAQGLGSAAVATLAMSVGRRLLADRLTAEPSEPAPTHEVESAPGQPGQDLPRRKVATPESDREVAASVAGV